MEIKKTNLSQQIIFLHAGTQQRRQFIRLTAILTHVDCERATETHCELVDSSVLVDDIENSVVIGEVGFVIHCPLKCGTGAFTHRRCVAL